MSADALAVTTRPPFGLRANATRARSISPTSRVSIVLNSTADDDAMDWIAANWPIPAASAGIPKELPRARACGPLATGGRRRSPVPLTWGNQVEALGWTSRDLFGLHKPAEKPPPS